MNRLLLFLKNPFTFSAQEQEDIFNNIEFYQGGIKYWAAQVKKAKAQDTEFKFQPPLLKISERYVFGKRCLAYYLSTLLGRKIRVDEISNHKLVGKYVLCTNDSGKYISYYDAATARDYMAREKHFGIYVQHRSGTDQSENFFNNY